ncbi:MAG: hypothetical protein ABMA14_25155, partial [Hyphomonadaceae bacterium]
MTTVSYGVFAQTEVLDLVTDETSFNARVAALPNGGFAIAYGHLIFQPTGNTADGTIDFKAFDGLGVALTDSITVNVVTNGFQSDAKIAVAPNGSIGIVFESQTGGANPSHSVLVRWMDANFSLVSVGESEVPLI